MEKRMEQGNRWRKRGKVRREEEIKINENEQVKK